MEKKNQLNVNHNIKSVLTMQNLTDALYKCNKGVLWKGSVQKYNRYVIQNMFSAVDTITAGELPALTKHLCCIYIMHL